MQLFDDGMALEFYSREKPSDLHIDAEDMQFYFRDMG